LSFFLNIQHIALHIGGRHGRDRMIVGFITNCAISAHHH